jgi:hypothetical protein
MASDPRLIGVHVGRKQSPALELAMQDHIGSSLAALLSTKGLYQNMDVDLSVVGQFSTENPTYADSGWTTQNLIAELKQRPWYPVSYGHGDPPEDGESRARFLRGTGTSRTPIDELPLQFPLPDVETWCRVCRKATAHASISKSGDITVNHHLPKIGPETLQLYVLYYSCSLCRSSPLIFLVKRQGNKLQLCGRSQRPYFDPPAVIPKEFRDVFSDAISAVSENDVPAGFYHLRTFAEHYMKKCLNIAVDQQMTGDDLVAQYNASLDCRMSGAIPSMSTIYANASRNMHERSTDVDAFNQIADDIVGHCEAKALFTRYGSGQTQGTSGE